MSVPGLSQKDPGRRPRKTARLPVIPCGVAIIRRGRQILISQRRPDDTLGLYWEFPGGKKMSGESFEECARREAEEELGVQVAVRRLFMDVKKRYDTKIVWLNFFLCDYLGGEPRPLECERVLWSDVTELPNFQFPPANKRVIESLLREYA